MRLKIDIVDEFARADPGAIDDEIEFWIDVFEFLETNARVDFAAGFLKSVCEIIQIDGCVHERDAEGEAALKDRSGNSKRFLHFGRNDMRT